MTSIFTAKALPAAAVALAAIGLGCSSIAADNHDAPLSCEMSVTQTGGMLNFEGRVEADRDLSGRYEFQVEKSRGGSVNISQGGSFSLKAGESTTLGQAMLNGRRSDIDAELTLTVDGQRYRCGDTGPIDL